MTKSEVMAQWEAGKGARVTELTLALTGNPRERVAISVDTLAVLVLLAKRSSIWLDYGISSKSFFDCAVEEALCLCDERAHEVIENQCADYHAHVAEWTQAPEK